jgi:hypothetical protein
MPNRRRPASLLKPEAREPTFQPPLRETGATRYDEAAVALSVKTTPASGLRVHSSAWTGRLAARGN